MFRTCAEIPSTYILDEELFFVHFEFAFVVGCCCSFQVSRGDRHPLNPSSSACFVCPNIWRGIFLRTVFLEYNIFYYILSGKLSACVFFFCSNMMNLCLVRMITFLITIHAWFWLHLSIITAAACTMLREFRDFNFFF